MTSTTPEEQTGPPDQVTLPRGRTVELAGRGSLFVRQGFSSSSGDQNPPLVLLHGWGATADLNWFSSYEALEGEFDFLAPDLRGHGRGIHDGRRFRLADVADDVAALITAEIGRPATIVGYSMGGTVAQLLWRRHPELVAGLVLCSTAANFRSSRREHLFFSAVSLTAALARLTPGTVRSDVAWWVMSNRGGRELRQWAIAELEGHDWLRIVEAGHEIGRFDSRRWLGGLDVPAAQILTLDDEIIPARRQEELALTIGQDPPTRIRGGHSVCIENPAVFAPTLTAAAHAVAARISPPRGSSEAARSARPPGPRRGRGGFRDHR